MASTEVATASADAASPWGGAHFFSLWYPAAGVRLALLWRIGARFTPVLIVEECVIQLLTGTVMWGGPEFLNQLGGVARRSGFACFAQRRLHLIEIHDERLGWGAHDLRGRHLHLERRHTEE